MPIAFTNLTNDRGTDGISTDQVTASITLPANRVAIAVIVNVSDDPGTPVPTLVGPSGANWQQIITHRVSPQRVTAFRCKPTANVTGTHTIGFGAVNQYYRLWSIDHGNADVDATGSEGANAIVQAIGGGALAAASPLVLTLAAFGNSVDGAFGAFATGYESVALVGGGGFTELATPSPGEGAFSDRALLVEYTANSDTTVDMTHGSAGTIDIWTGIALQIKAAGGGGAAVASRGGIALSGISAINGIAKSGISAINGLTI